MLTFKKARWIDRKIGKPICYLIYILRFFRRKKTINLNDIRKVLIIKMYGIGSIILMSPVFYNLKQNYPKSKIFLMTLCNNKGLYEGSPYIDGTIYFDLSSVKSALVAFCKIMRWLRHDRFDIVFDFEIASRFTAILTFLCKSRLKVGYVPSGSGKNIFDITITYNESVHMTNIFLRALDILGLNISNDKLLPLPITKEEKQKVYDFLDKYRIRNCIAFNPNASEMVLERMWPIENYVELGKRLFERIYDLEIIIIGGSNDIERVSYLQKQLEESGKVFSVAGKFGVKETTFLLSKAQVFISNDSGPLHMGSVADVATIGLFGPETPVLFGPRGIKHTSLVSKEICSPCLSAYKDKVINCYKNVDCMKNITVDEVLSATIEKYQMNFVPNHISLKKPFIIKETSIQSPTC